MTPLCNQIEPSWYFVPWCTIHINSCQFPSITVSHILLTCDDLCCFTLSLDGRCLWVMTYEKYVIFYNVITAFSWMCWAKVWWPHCLLRIEPSISLMWNKRANHVVTTFGFFHLSLNRNTFFITNGHKFNSCTCRQDCRISCAVSLMTNQNCPLSAW